MDNVVEGVEKIAVDEFRSLPSDVTFKHLDWRTKDREQCHLGNARKLWTYCTNQNRQALDEHAEYVRAMATLAAFMAGFVNIAFVQFDFATNEVPYGVLLGFAISNSLTTGLSTCCMMACILILCGTFRISAILMAEEEEAEFIFNCRRFAHGFQIGSRPPVPQGNFRSHWAFLCQGEWHRALAMFSCAILCFTANTAFAAFIKFPEYKAASITLASCLGLGVILCVYFHLHWIPALFSSPHTLQEESIHAMGLPFDWHLPGLRNQQYDTNLQEDTQCKDAETWNELPHARQEVLQQRLMNNAIYLWQQFSQRSDDSVEERVEQLRSFSFLSGVVAGFAVAALLQLNFDISTTPHGFQLWFSTSAGLTAGCATVSMAMCSLMLMSTKKISRGLTSEEEEAQFLARCFQFANMYEPGMQPPYPQRSFQSHWDVHCEGEWSRAFYLFNLGLAAFVVNVMSGAWIKYSPFTRISVAATVIMSLAMIYLIQLHFRWAPYLRSRIQSGMNFSEQDIQPVGLPFDWHLPPKRAVNSQQRDQRVQTSQKKLSETLHRLNSLGMSRSRAMRKE